MLLLLERRETIEKRDAKKGIDRLDARVNQEVSFRIEYFTQSRSTNFFIINVKELRHVYLSARRR